MKISVATRYQRYQRFQRIRRVQGFSLVELLLTLVLILCLAAASVFTFTAIYRSANLDEGYDRFQSLIRFAQAEAATTGRKVRLEFEPAGSGASAGSLANTSASSEEHPELRNIKVTWEADLLNAPGVFQVYTNKSWSEEMVNELVGIEKVQAIQSTPSPAPAQKDNSVAASDETGPVAAPTSDFPAITFYPDGSCDSAEIVLASRNSEDERRIAVRLSGILGSVTSRTISGSGENNTEEEPLDELDDETDAQPSASAPALAQVPARGE